MKKISTLVGVIIIIVAVVIIFGGVFAYKYFSNPQTSIAETASLKTYKNVEYGFKIKYLDEGRTHITDWVRDDFSNTDVSIPKDGLLTFGQYITANGDGTPICVSYSVNVSSANGKDINGWIKEVKAYNDRSFDYQGMAEEGRRVNGKITSIKDVSVGNNLGKLVLIQGGYPLNTGEFGVIKDNKIYSITYFDNTLDGHIKCKNSSKDYQDIFNKMISSFEFTN